MDLPPDEVHLWLVFPDETDDPALLERYLALLSEDERERQQRFHFSRHRHQYLITRALVRTTLSRYGDVAPEDWRFSTNEHGRPEISAAQNPTELRFNLSHTDGLIICGVLRGRDIGVDVEDTGRKSETVAIAERFFSEQECRDLRALAPQRQRERFFDYWTLKESYIKACGRGLSLPLGLFSFHFQEAAPLRLSCDPALADDPRRWQFCLLEPTQRHKMALCAERSGRPRYRLFMRKVVPLLCEQTFRCTMLAEG